MSVTIPLILVVEDDLILGRLFFKVIKSISPNAKIDWFLSAEEALVKIDDLEVANGTRHDLVISDINLTGQTSGIDLWKACVLRNMKSKFMFISGISESEFRTRSGAGPNVAFLQKPFSITAAKTAVETGLQESFAQAPA